MVTVLLALLQANAAVLDVDANCAAVEDAARTAAAAGAEVLLTPELFPVGYAPLRVRAGLDAESTTTTEMPTFLSVAKATAP